MGLGQHTELGFIMPSGCVPWHRVMGCYGSVPRHHTMLCLCPLTPHHAMSMSPDTTQCHGVPMQAISSSPFILQVGQLPILTQLLQCHNDIPASRFPPGC